MAGSTAEVLLRTRLTEEQLSELKLFVRSASGSEDWSSFWILGQPFTMALKVPDDEYQASLLEWLPAQTIVVACHCRSRAGDVLLAFTVARLAEMFAGLIAFGDRLENFSSDPSLLTLQGRFRSELTGEVLTPAVLKYWADSAEFRMSN